MYLGETMRRLETQLREHKDACRKAQLEKLAVAEHAWTHQHAIDWKKTSVINWARGQCELLLKEALTIQLTPEEERLNCDEGLELPGCWAATIRAVTSWKGQRSGPAVNTSQDNLPPGRKNVIIKTIKR